MDNLLEYPKYPTGTNAHLAPANAAMLHADLLDTKREFNAAKRVLRNAILANANNAAGRMVPQVDEVQLARYRQDLHLATEEYNQAVRAWHAAWTPWRTAERLRRRQVREQLQAQAQATQRANLRAAACPVCTLIHAGEC